MRIGIDVFSFDKPNENFGVGPGVYAWKLVNELIHQFPDDEFVIFTNRNTHTLVPRGPNVTVVVSRLSTRYRMLRVFHEQIMLPFWFVTKQLQVIHHLGNNISFLLARRSVLTVYDLMWKYYTDRGVKSLRYRYAAFTIPRSIRYAKSIITISSFIAGEIVQNKLRDARIYPILLAPGDITTVAEDDVSDTILRVSRHLYVYSVTTSMPHKNLNTLLLAFKKLVEIDKIDASLVISGQLKGSFYLKTLKFISENRLEDKIVLTGYVSECDKAWLYRHAAMVVYPSLYEGFGLPILEAMAHDVPVIASRAASMPEVGGTACLYFDPNSATELATAMVTLLNDEALREKLRTDGRIQHKKFTWQETTRQTRLVYDTIADLP